MEVLHDQKALGRISHLKLGAYLATFTGILTVITFGIAVFTPPLSGPFCTEGCFEYPYHDIASRFPRDYIWMYPAIFLSLLYVIFMISIKNYASPDKKIYGEIGVAFSLISTTILISDYFVQISIIQVSLLQGETESISLLSQYNPHGIFIVLEEIGYLIMSFSFMSVAFIFSKDQRLERTIRWIFIFSFIMAMISLLTIIFIYGIRREYRFEVAVITINWLVLIVNGLLLGKLFNQRYKSALQQ